MTKMPAQKGRRRVGRGRPDHKTAGAMAGAIVYPGRTKNSARCTYLPAIVATWHNPDLKAQYDRMNAAGRPSKVAITAIMRKLLILANTLVKEDRECAEIRA